MRSEDELGVLIEAGLSDWQILQQDENGRATLYNCTWPGS
jgi:hypothetical protein